MSSPKLNRREAALTVAALGAVAAAPLPAAAQPAAPPALTWTPKGLTLAQARTLDVMAELIIPATDTPGAREAGVAKFVDQAVADYCRPGEQKVIRDGLDRADAEARAQYGKAFVDLAQDQQINMLRRYDAERAGPTAPEPVGRGDTETGLSNRVLTPPPIRPFFATLKELVTVAYFTSKDGATKAVKWDPNPGAYHGCVPLAQIGRAWAL